MLVLSRKAAEAIEIGDGIRITVLAIAGGRVRLGIEAPKELTVLRKELIAAPVGERVEMATALRQAANRIEGV